MREAESSETEKYIDCGKRYWEIQTVLSWSVWLGYDIGYSLNKIHNLDKYSPSFNDESIIEMQNAAIRGNKMFVKNDGFLTLVKGGTSPRPRYNIYDVYWNETKSNINIHEYEVAAIWNVGKDSCSVYRIWEEKDERERIIRNNKLNLLLTI